MFANQLFLFDQNLILATFDRLFIATNVKMKKSDSASELKRYQFLEILVRIANAKFREPGICSTFAESLEKLI